MISDAIAYGPVYPACIVVGFAIALAVATVREHRRERTRPYDWSVD